MIEPNEHTLQQVESHLATRQPESAPAANLLAVISRAAQDSTVDVDKMERLLAMAERMEKREAEKAFALDMIALQQELPVILANASVPNDDGTIRYKFGQIDYIAGILRPIALKHGFTYSFGEFGGGSDPSRVTKTCTVMHRGGHSPTPTAFTVRIGKGPPKSSEAQGDGAAATYAQRRALCDAFGIIVDKDSDGADASVVGAYIAPEKAEELRARVAACKADSKAFLIFANQGNEAGTWETIGEAHLPEIEAMLRKAEARFAAKGGAQ